MRQPPTTILCPSDLSPTGDGAVHLAYALAPPGSTVHLLHVSTPAAVPTLVDGTVLLAASGFERQVADEEQVTRHLKRLVPEDALSRGIRTEVHVVEHTGPAGVIAREAARLKADLIVVGTRARGGIAGAVLGSVAQSVLRHAGTPVVLFHDVP
jgi:nucleotide-binding universal stress UspA family protein